MPKFTRFWHINTSFKRLRLIFPKRPVLFLYFYLDLPLNLLPHILQWEWNEKLIFAARKALQRFQHVFLHCSAFTQSQHNGKGLCKLHSGNCWISYKQEHIPVTCKQLLNQHTFFFCPKKTEGCIFFNQDVNGLQLLTAVLSDTWTLLSHINDS